MRLPAEVEALEVSEAVCLNYGGSTAMQIAALQNLLFDHISCRP